jgi:hypothetical protein
VSTVRVRGTYLAHAGMGDEEDAARPHHELYAAIVEGPTARCSSSSSARRRRSTPRPRVRGHAGHAAQEDGAVTPPVRKIAINTGGGDAPGLNAVIRAVVMAGIQRGWEVCGIRDGYNGLLEPESYPEGGLVKLSRLAVMGIGHLGGTILGTTNRGNPLHYPRRAADGSETEHDRCDEVVQRFREQGFDALVSVGGDGSLEIAHSLAQKGLRVICVPKTIDNDLERTFMTFGFDSAVSFATECLDRLHTTATSHRRIMVVEVMGRYAGWIALHAGMAGNAHVILIPEIPYDLGVVAEYVKKREARGATTRWSWWPKAPSRRAESHRIERAKVIAWAESASRWPRSSKIGPGRRPVAWCSATCCAAGRPPASTGWWRSASARPRCEPWKKAKPRSWSRSRPRPSATSRWAKWSDV